MRYIFLLFFLFLFQSINAAEKKYTVCSLTINSSEERELFKRKLDPEKFRFVELVPEDEEKNPAWFQRACQSGIQCDIVLISGHFGGKFFGKSGKVLGADQLESMSCAQTCDGILKHPKEVYLFGCNTLADKSPDSRTPEQYLQVLINDGFERSLAERITALRYSPIGRSNKMKMERAFSGAQNIYGFYSIAPTGKHIQASLSKYFDLVGDYTYIVDNILYPEVSAFGKDFWNLKTLGIYASSTKGLGGEISQTLTCQLQSQANGREKKLLVINQMLNASDRLSYMMNVEEFFRNNSLLNLNSKEKKILKSIQSNVEAKNELLNVLNYIDYSFHYINTYLSLGIRLGWLSLNERNEILTKMLMSVLNKGKITYADKEEICLSGVKHPFLKLEQLDQDQLQHNRYYLDVLECLNIKDPDFFRALSQMLLDGQEDMAIRAAMYLGRGKYFDDEIKQNIFLALDRKKIDGFAAYAMGKYVTLKNKREIEALTKLLKIEYSGESAAVIFSKLKPKDELIHVSLVEALNVTGVGSAAEYAIREIRPRGAKFVKALKQMAKQNSTGGMYAKGLIKYLGIR